MPVQSPQIERGKFVSVKRQFVTKVLTVCDEGCCRTPNSRDFVSIRESERAIHSPVTLHDPRKGFDASIKLYISVITLYIGISLHRTDAARQVVYPIKRNIFEKRLDFFDFIVYNN